MAKRKKSGKNRNYDNNKSLVNTHLYKLKGKKRANKDEGDDDDNQHHETWSKSKKKRMRLLKARRTVQGLGPDLFSAGNHGPDDDDRNGSSDEDEQAAPPPQEKKQKTSSAPSSSSSELVESFKARLSGSRFRLLNEELYTSTSQESFQRFAVDHPEWFHEYHAGFRHQVSTWPVNPVQVILKRIRKRQFQQQWRADSQDKAQSTDNEKLPEAESSLPPPKDEELPSGPPEEKKQQKPPQQSTMEEEDSKQQKSKKKKDEKEKKEPPPLPPKPTGRQKQWVVADLGCGDAQLAQELLKVRVPTEPQTAATKKKNRKDDKDNKAEEYCPFVVHSFDLAQPDDPATKHLVTPCDMAHVPLPDESVDMAVFCLALMGTNMADFIREAHRILKPTGCVYIAEVQSRFTPGRMKPPPPQPKKMKKKRSQEEDEEPKTPPKKEELDTSLEYFLKALFKLGFRCKQQDMSNKMFFLLELIKGGNKPRKQFEYMAKPCIYKRR